MERSVETQAPCLPFQPRMFRINLLTFLAMAVIRHYADVENQEAARRIIKDLDSLIESGGFKLAKWASNDSSILSDIAVEKRASTDNREILRTLGLHWNRDRDEFTFVALITENEKNCTKRKLISDASKLFDPLGF
ncbi:hypothetical protein T09_9830 [Trichinella sp. T9]|nr:hypothetical protein T09_9830 [Trichinella sp. T9]